MGSSKTPVATTAKDSPETAPAPQKRGPKVTAMPDLTSFAESLSKLSPKERKAHRTETAETMLDLFMHRMLDMLASEKCRAQTLLVAASFFKKNEFVVEPSAEGKEDYLDRLARERKEAAADEARRLKNIEREKAKREAKAEAFYQKQGNPTEPTKRLNTGDPGEIGVTTEEIAGD